MSTAIEVVLSTVADLVRHDARKEFRVNEVVRRVAISHPHIRPNTVRASISSYLCMTAPAFQGRHRVGFEQVGRGCYRVVPVHQRYA